MLHCATILYMGGRRVCHMYGRFGTITAWGRAPTPCMHGKALHMRRGRLPFSSPIEGRLTMDVKELLKMLTGEDEDAAVDDTATQGVQSSEGNTAAEGDLQNNDSSEDTNSTVAELVKSLNEKSEALDNTNARVDKLEKVLTQLLTKGAATSSSEQSNDAPKEYVPLQEMDFVTPAPKV